MSRKTKFIFPALAALALGLFPGQHLMTAGPAEASVLVNVAQAAAPAAADSARGQLTSPESQGTTGIQRDVRQTVTAAEAFAMLNKAVENGQTEAMLGLASLYEQGLGVSRDHTKAFEWYQKAAEAGLAAGYYQVGMAYESGKGVTASRDEAIKAYTKAAELKVPEAPYKLAAMSMAGAPPKPDDKKALEYLKNGGLAGPKAMEVLGNFYENGVGLAPNFTEAFNWYKKAADSGLPEAIFRLGTCYETGLGTKANPQEAIKNFQKAADLKMAPAAYKLAAVYLAGHLTPVDHKKAIDYMNMAVNNGHAPAANELGVVYLQGMLGQQVDTDKALDMFIKSADLGNPEAMKNIAVMFKNGMGRKPDPTKALKWYLIAQKAGYQAEGVEDLIAEIKKNMKDDQISSATAEADKWTADFAAKNQPKVQ